MAGKASGRLRGFFVEAGHDRVEEHQQGLFDRIPFAGVAIDDRDAVVYLKCAAHIGHVVVQLTVEPVDGDNKRHVALLEVVDGVEAIGESTRVREDYGAESTLGDVVPHETEARLPWGSEEEQYELLIDREATEVHGHCGGGLLADFRGVVDTDAGAGDRRFGTKRLDFRHRSNECGLADTKATGYYKLGGDLLSLRIRVRGHD